MTTKQLKSEIVKALDDLNEKELEDALNYIKNRHEQTMSSIDNHLNKIISEDKELLKKLAQ